MTDEYKRFQREMIKADVQCLRELRKGPPRDGDPHVETLLVDDIRKRWFERHGGLSVEGAIQILRDKLQEKGLWND